MGYTIEKRLEEEQKDDDDLTEHSPLVKFFARRGYLVVVSSLTSFLSVSLKYICTVVTLMDHNP